MTYSADIKKLPRHYLPVDFEIKDWEGLLPFFQELEEREIDSVTTLEQWLKDASELEAAISEEVCWRQIKMTCDTENKELEASFTFFMMEIQPKMQPFSDRLNKKLLDCKFTSELDTQKYFTYLRNVKKNIDLFEEKNIPAWFDVWGEDVAHAKNELSHSLIGLKKARIVTKSKERDRLITSEELHILTNQFLSLKN